MIVLLFLMLLLIGGKRHPIPTLVPARSAGFQRCSQLLAFPHVRDNNNNHENHSAPMQKAADLEVPGEF